MKKTISLFLIIAMLISLVTFSVSAETENLLVNGDFESGDLSGWQVSGPTSKLTVTENARNGKCGILVSERTGRYSTVAQDIYDTFYNNGKGKWQASAWVKLDKAVEEEVKCQLVISYVEEGQATKWITSKILTLTTEWQEFTIEKDINVDIYKLESMYLYPQVESASHVDFVMDDVSFKKLSAVTKPDPNYVQTDTVENATTENLIENSDFESGDEADYLIMGNSEWEFEKDYARTGEYGLKISERTTQYTTIGYDLTDVLWDYGPGKYRACVYVRLADEFDVPKNIKCELVIRYNLRGKSTQYITSGKKVLGTEWKKFVIERDIPFDPNELASIEIYPQVLGANADIKVDFCVDDFSLYKTSAIVEVEGEKIEDIEVENVAVTPIDVTNTARNPQLTSVGVIRWDAWYGHDGSPTSVISQVEKTLSPKEFHFRAPFFAEVTESGGITIPEYTQEIFDKEMEYAHDAGIDYFAFLWYSDAMEAARKFYQTSKYNDKVKMCIIMGGGEGTAEQHQEMAKLLKEGYYMTVLNGRPLMYYDCAYKDAKAQIKYYRGLCKKLGIPEPYAVCLKLDADQMLDAGGDAIGDYAISNSSQNITFNELASKAVGRWKSLQRGGTQYVPIVTTGYHLLPRFKNQVNWMTVENDAVAQYATADEIKAHLFEALEYMQQAEVIEKTKINTVLMYAWNEHDEGGWICPTIKVDENGNQLYDENGQKLIDTSRIEAVKQAISEFKVKYSAPVSSDPLVDDQPTASPMPVQTDKNVIPYIIAAGAVVLVILGAVAVIIIKKKKQGENK